MEDTSLFSSIPDFKTILVGIGFVLIMQYLQNNFQTNRRRTNLSVHASKKYAERNQKRGRLHEFLKQYPVCDAKMQEKILSLSASDLAKQIKLGKIKSLDATVVYCHRAILLGSATNAVTEEFYDDAIEQAKKVDEMVSEKLENNEKFDDDSLLLLGVPVSIKDQFYQKGADSTMGLAIRCFAPAYNDGLYVRIIREQGGIPFVRTNVPQSLLIPECDNIIWGLCTNAYNATRSAGGSSGGEAVLLSLRATPFGIGTDVGGSIRIPAHFNGVCGFKPSHSRATREGAGVPRVKDANGQEVIISSPGPMSRFVDDLVTHCRMFINESVFKFT